MDNLYFFLSSEDYLTSIYPNNTPIDFICDLTETYSLEGDYECSVIDLIIKKRSGRPTPRTLYLFCDICSDSYVKETKLPLVKIIDTKNKELSLPIYINVKSSQFNKIRMYIKDGNLNTASVSPITVLMCTLHLRKKRQ